MSLLFFNRFNKVIEYNYLSLTRLIDLCRPGEAGWPFGRSVVLLWRGQRFNWSKMSLNIISSWMGFFIKNNSPAPCPQRPEDQTLYSASSILVMHEDCKLKYWIKKYKISAVVRRNVIGFNSSKQDPHVTLNTTWNK